MNCEWVSIGFTNDFWTLLEAVENPVGSGPIDERGAAWKRSRGRKKVVITHWLAAPTMGGPAGWQHGDSG